MPKVEIVTLKDMEVIEVDGEYETRFMNEKRYPAAITNYSLSMGEKMGLTKGSQLTDLIKLSAMESVRRDLEQQQLSEESIEAAEGIDIHNYLKVIYLAIIGLNRKLDLTFDDFLEKYHEDTLTIIQTYVSLVLASMNINKNQFAEGFKKKYG
ncbi:hypothetical protein [Piscibacillus salipiscarius]|uniref:hypothetical protein n=1 Tax=Piscibacillus salipiscarius TaxID=299480 RepID=UPI0006CF99FE|nr:hypothetical protein [Piscibacillus salipiscarius]